MTPLSLRIFVVSGAALLTDHRPHGDGLVAYGFIRELARRGHEIHVAAGRVDLSAELPANVRVYPLIRDGGHSRAERVLFMARLRRLYRRLGGPAAFEVVHQLTPVEVGVSLALGDLGVPLVLGPYVPDWPSSGEGADGTVGPLALRAKRVVRAAQQSRATTVLLSTPAASSKVERPEGSRLRVRDLPLGVDDRAWVPVEEKDVVRQEVLFLANLEVRKGIHVLLSAFEDLAPQLPSARLRIAGAGQELERVRHRIQASPARAQMQLLGRVDRDQARAAMQACSVYCLPSYGDPCPLAAVEAMACARPVVATNAGGLGHLVPDGGGLKVPPGDSVALAEALGKLLADPQGRRAMGRHNRQVVEHRYAWPRVVDRLEEHYQEAIREPLSRGR